MADPDFRAQFEMAMDAFLAPILAAVGQGDVTCHVYLVHPEERAVDEDFALPAGEFESYARFTLQQGFFAAVRLVVEDGARAVHLIAWEGSTKVVWPAHGGEVLETWVWAGYPPRDMT